MPNLLASGAAWLHSQRHDHLTETVIYRIGGTGSGTELQATRGRTGADQLIHDQLITSGGIDDFLFLAADFDLAADPPRPRDTIEDTDGKLWEVAEIGGEPCWRHSDPHRNAIRVHVVSQAE
jgi:hypothetical protein